MSRLRELGESLGSTVLDGIGKASARVQERKPLPVDLLESEEAFLAVFDAPGVEAPDVAVRFENGVLKVRIDRFREFYDDHEMRLPGRGMSLDGEVALPEGASVDPAGATATVTANGTLRVELPKTEDSTGSVGDDTTADVEVGGDDPVELDAELDGTAGDADADAGENEDEE